MELKLAKKQLKDSEIKAKTVRDKIVEVCANPAIYESEVERAELDYTKKKKYSASMTGLMHVYAKFSSKVPLQYYVSILPAREKLLLVLLHLCRTVVKSSSISRMSILRAL